MTPDCRIRWRFQDGTEIETDGYRALNILAHAETYELRIAQACGGQAECGTCRFRLIEGELSPMVVDEAQLLEEHRSSFASDERLACRARPLSDLVVELRGRAPADLRDGDVTQ